MSWDAENLSKFDPLQHTDDSKNEVDKAIVFGEKTRVGTQQQIKDERNTKSTDERTSEVNAFYDFQLFAKQLQEPSAEPIIKYTKSFLRNFQTQRDLWTATEQTKLINDFKIFIYDKFSEYEPFKSMDDVMLRNAQEGIEKLIMGKLYTKCFSPCLQNLGDRLDEDHKKDLNDDKELRNKVREFRFIKPRELDIQESVCDRLDKFSKFSGKELSNINHFKAPRDKMICVLNTCKVIFGILRNQEAEEKGADTFIPLLIYTILKNNIRALASNANYIERFRYEDFIRGEASYYLNSLHAAINFIATLERSSLSIDNNENFEERYSLNQKKIIEEEELSSQQSSSNAVGGDDVDQSSQKQTSPLPSEYILSPLDDAANAVMSKFNELFSSSKQEALKNDRVMPPATDHAVDDESVDKLAKKLLRQEQESTLETLQAMFPEMDGAIIEDVCIAKKYRVGATVDVLLSLQH